MSSELRFIKIAVPLVWVGFVAAISFMEAWLKFTVPDVTLAIGLGIGKVVFGALNRVEIFFCALLLVLQRRVRWGTDAYFFVVALIVGVQSLYMLPALTARIEMYQAGNIPPPSDLHVVYVALEAVKIACLLIYGTKQLTYGKFSKPIAG